MFRLVRDWFDDDGLCRLRLLTETTCPRSSSTARPAVLKDRFHPAPKRNAPIAIILHPHPQFGGTMNNQIVYNLYYSFAERGFSVLRFNFRGRWTQPRQLRSRFGRIVGRGRGARLGAIDPPRGACLLDRRRVLRLVDRHAAADATAGDRGLHLGRAAGQPLRLLVPCALPVVGPVRSWRYRPRRAV